MKNEGIGTVAIVVIVIVVAAVAAGGYMVMSGGEGGGEEWEEVSGGPTTSAQALSSGQGIGVPLKKGMSASYGYYQSGSRVGEYTVTNVGEEYFQGVSYRKIEGSGNLNFSVQEKSVKFSMDVTGYFENTGMPKQLSYTFHYTQPKEKDVDMEYTWNESQSEMVTEVSGQTTTADLPTEYWNTISAGDLYVGYSKQMTYTIESTSVTLSIEVIGREDVTVPKGTFEDCYLVKLSQPEINQEGKYWINEEGVMPKMNFSQTIGTTSLTFTMKLEHYGYKP